MIFQLFTGPASAKRSHGKGSFTSATKIKPGFRILDLRPGL
jgi:hypothetical protein